MSVDPESILLDTHIWLWLASGAEKGVSPNLRTLIERLAPHGRVKISAISVWEIGILTAKGKIAFDCPVKEWVNQGLRDSRVGIQDVNSEIAIESTLLLDFHEDPADRILIATTRYLNATLITRDKEILSYAKKHHFPALSL